MKKELNVDFPLILDKKYIGFVDYLLLKQELAQKPFLEARTFDGMRLVAKLMLSFRSIRQGYKHYRALEAKLNEHSSLGESITISHRGDKFTVSVR